VAGGLAHTAYCVWRTASHYLTLHTSHFTPHTSHFTLFLPLLFSDPVPLFHLKPDVYEKRDAGQDGGYERAVVVAVPQKISGNPAEDHRYKLKYTIHSLRILDLFFYDLRNRFRLRLSFQNISDNHEHRQTDEHRERQERNDKRHEP
jgi:hypothetical protein